MTVAGSTTKKVQIHRWERDSVAGFVNAQSYLTDVGAEVITQAGNVTVIPYEQIKAVHFVRDLEDAGRNPERKVFLGRPKTEGLWVRLHFRDGDVLEGIVPNNLLQLESRGVMVAPPDANANTQRIFVPREALREVKVLSVVGSPLRGQTRRKKPEEAGKDQIGLFDEQPK